MLVQFCTVIYIIVWLHSTLTSNKYHSPKKKKKQVTNTDEHYQINVASSFSFGLLYKLRWTKALHFLCFAVLYAFFGLQLLYIAWRSDSKSSQKKEMKEVFSVVNHLSFRDFCILIIELILFLL